MGAGPLTSWCPGPTAERSRSLLLLTAAQLEKTSTHRCNKHAEVPISGAHHVENKPPTAVFQAWRSRSEGACGRCWCTVIPVEASREAAVSGEEKEGGAEGGGEGRMSDAL